MKQCQSYKSTEPRNRLIGDMPKIGIRPTIDGRLGGVRESLEEQTMAHGAQRGRASSAKTCATTTACRSSA